MAIAVTGGLEALKQNLGVFLLDDYPANSFFGLTKTQCRPLLSIHPRLYFASLQPLATKPRNKIKTKDQSASLVFRDLAH